MMKQLRKILLSLAMVSTIFTLSGNSASAQDAKPYAYTITLSAGNKGTISGQSKITLTTDLAAGSSMNVDVNGLVEVTDDKYYIKGIRLSGHDNEEAAVVSPLVEGNGDQDYVVAYGMKGNMVAYTVSFQDAAGNDLAPAITLYGNPGDKPVVAYRYIENFVPQALAMTKTLSENETDNVFAFVYTPGTTGTVVETTTPTVTIIDNTAAVTPAAGTAGTAGTAGGTTTDGAAAGADGGAGTTTDGTGEVIADEQTPQALVDLDEEETPAANKKLDEDNTAKKIPMGIAFAIIVVAVAALITLFIVLKKRAK